MAKAKQFKPGDVVRLRSGGPKMTVETAADEGEDEVNCQWFTVMSSLAMSSLAPEVYGDSNEQYFSQAVLESA